LEFGVWSEDKLVLDGNHSEVLEVVIGERAAS
jgi:hypothetical protein